MMMLVSKANKLTARLGTPLSAIQPTIQLFMAPRDAYRSPRVSTS